jgi:hypothetical protein
MSVVVISKDKIYGPFRMLAQAMNWIERNEIEDSYIKQLTVPEFNSF